MLMVIPLLANQDLTPILENLESMVSYDNLTNFGCMLGVRVPSLQKTSR